MQQRRPVLFIGSSSEGLKIAKALEFLLNRTCEVIVWNQGAFGLSQGTLESLVSRMEIFDFAILALTPDDLVTSRDQLGPAPRDNVLFELGLFMGSLGRERTFLVYDRTADLKLPSDLAGVTAATFEPPLAGTLFNALGAASAQIEQEVERLGMREVRRLRALTEAANDFDRASSQMQLLVQLLARSRKVELEITAAHFGALMKPDEINSIRRDLKELDLTLRKVESEKDKTR